MKSLVIVHNSDYFDSYLGVVLSRIFNAAQPGVGRVQVLGIKKMEEEELLGKSLEMDWVFSLEGPKIGGEGKFRGSKRTWSTRPGVPRPGVPRPGVP